MFSKQFAPQVAKTASLEEIKKAYRKEAVRKFVQCLSEEFKLSCCWFELNARSKVRHHPDKHNDASEEEKAEHERKFKDIAEAFSVLSDTKLR